MREQSGGGRGEGAKWNEKRNNPGNVVVMAATGKRKRKVKRKD